MKLAPIHDEVIGYYLGREVTDLEESLRLRKESGYLPAALMFGGGGGRDSDRRVYKCPYCDCWSDNDIGVCEHCGAVKE